LFAFTVRRTRRRQTMRLKRMIITVKRMIITVKMMIITVKRMISSVLMTMTGTHGPFLEVCF
jgi:hypothetical protein